MNGLAGADTMIGGLGNDVYYVDNAGDVVQESAGGGVDTVYSYVTYTLPTELDHLRIVGTGVVDATGNTLNNTIYAGDGDNVMDGAGGTDTVTYQYALGAVTVNLGLTTVQATGGSGNDVVRNFEGFLGSSFNDVVTGTDAANTLNGNGGADTMTGGLGGDSYYVDNVGDVIIEVVSTATSGTDHVNTYIDYTLGADIESGRILGSGAINLTGNDLSNTLYAGDGNNVIDGRLGTDTLTYSTSLLGGVTVDLSLATAQVTGGSGTDTILNIESLIGTTFNDVLIGDAGANSLNGNTGADSMSGGAGNDSYYVDNAADTVVELAAGGVDTVFAYISYTMAAEVEQARMLATGAANLSGNNLDNLIYAGAGDNVINGGAGIDTVSYALASAAVNVNLSLTAAQLTGGSGSDFLQGTENLVGSDFADTLTGNSAVNSLSGGKGNDRLDGGAGADVLTGGLGNDIYLVSRGAGVDTVVENDTTVGNADVIQFASNITSTQIAFARVGNNLEASVIGATDKVVVKDWYLGAAYHVEQFKAGDGVTWSDLQVQGLVTGIAAFGASTAAVDIGFGSVRGHMPFDRYRLAAA
jgi:Ca2+-binding RTX toxin-like protein